MKRQSDYHTAYLGKRTHGTAGKAAQAMGEFRYLPITGLPPSSWLATVQFATGACQVKHGRLVETKETFFVEGVWAGPFEMGGFDGQETFFGSGATRRATGIVFVPSCATVDYLYYKVTDEDVVCSNSLPFLLAAVGDQLDEFDDQYGPINDSIIKGIREYEQTIPTRQGNVSRLMYHNLVVSPQGVTQEEKPLPPPFNSFEGYRIYFEAHLRGLLENARDVTRTTPLRILSTQSSGYDSTAINAVAHKYGVDLAVSIEEAKEVGAYFRNRLRQKPRSDSGVEIARALGIESKSVSRRHFQKCPEAEHLYWAGIHGCQDLNLHGVSEFVGKGAVLLTGVLGELWYNTASIWPPQRLATFNDELVRWDPSCHGLSEVRLHIGYVHAAIPYIGARRRKELLEISDSEAMRPWSIGGSYDRPIARRLAEEAGIPREAFGQTKLATVVEWLPPYIPYGRALRREFFRYLVRRRAIRRVAELSLAPCINATLWRLYLRLRNARFAKRTASVLLFCQASQPDGTLIPGFGNRSKAILYAYCINKTARVYEEALRQF